MSIVVPVLLSWSNTREVLNKRGLNQVKDQAHELGNQ